jgi:hypothetical protein
LLGLRLGDYGKDFHSRSGYIVEDTHVVDPKTVLRRFNAAQALLCGCDSASSADGAGAFPLHLERLT